MDEEKLKAFYSDKKMMESVYTYFLNYLERMALVRVYEKRDTTGIPDAKEIIDGSLTELHERFGIKKKQKPKSVR